MKQKRSYKNYILPIVLSILILGAVSVFATNYINENTVTSPSGNFSSIQSNNTVINESGMFYSGSKTSVRTADVVVCRGTSLLDDLYKSFTCDVVCKSTDSDCQPYLQSTLGDNCNNKVVNWAPGNYPVLTRDQFSGKAFLFSQCSNFTLNAYNVNLFIDYNNDVSDQIGFEIEGSNSIINGLNILGNRLCNFEGSHNCFGFRLSGYLNDSGLSYCSSKYVKGFQVTFEPISISHNLFIDHFTGFGIGTNDIIGGGGSGSSDGLSVTNSYLVHQMDSSFGFYDGAIDLVWLKGVIISNNFVRGSLYIGTEGGSSSNIVISNNIVLPSLQSNGVPYDFVGYFGVYSSDCHDVVVSGNYVKGPTFYPGYNCTNQTWSGNTLTQFPYFPLANYFPSDSNISLFAVKDIYAPVTKMSFLSSGFDSANWDSGYLDFYSPSNTPFNSSPVQSLRIFNRSFYFKGNILQLQNISSNINLDSNYVIRQKNSSSFWYNLVNLDSIDQIFFGDLSSPVSYLLGKSVIFRATDFIVKVSSTGFGIATTNPQYTLDVNGSFNAINVSVNGTPIFSRSNSWLNENWFTSTNSQSSNQNGLLVYGGTNGGTIYARGDNSGGDDNLNLKAIDNINFVSSRVNFTNQDVYYGYAGVGTGKRLACFDENGRIYAGNSTGCP